MFAVGTVGRCVRSSPCGRRAGSTPSARSSRLRAAALPLLLALSCTPKAQLQPPPRVLLDQHACSDLPTCLDVLERSSELAAHEYAEERLAAFGAAAIPRLSWLLEQGDSISKYRAAGALGRIAASRPNEVLAAAGAVLHERCADRGWAACWALTQANDHSAYPLLARHLRSGVDIRSFFDDRRVPAPAAEWFLVELEDRNASAAVHTAVVDILLRAEGQLSPASLERLRDLLRAELPADFSNIPPGYPCSSSGGDCWYLVDRKPDTGQCPASFSECWSRVDYLVEALGAWGPAGGPARSELRAVWESAPAAHKYIARKALARIGDRAIVPSLLSELSPLDERALRDLRLLGEAARPELPQLSALFQQAPGNERAALLETILAIGGPAALEIGIEALYRPGDDDVTALEGLSRASQQSAVADALRKERARLEYLAAQSVHAQVRRLASELLVALGLEAPAARSLPCPHVVTTQIEALAQLASGSVSLKPLGNPARNSEDCAKGDIATLRVGGECLHGQSFGEFGHQIMVHEAGSAQPRDRVRGVGLNPLQFLRFGEHLLVIEGLAHGMNRGNIDRLLRESDGRWVAHRFTDLPGVPVSYAFDAEHRLLLLVQESFPGSCQADNGGWLVVRVGSDGTLEALR